MKKLFTIGFALILTMSLLVFSAACDGKEVEDTPQIKNIVLIIGDGMGAEHVAAGQLAYDKQFAFAGWNRVNVNTDSLREKTDYPCHTTDSAASGTALATGVLTYNGYVGKDIAGNDLETILDVAKSKGKATGVLTTDTLDGATPACFSAHSYSRNNRDEILNSQLSSGVDFLGASSTTKQLGVADIEAAGYTFYKTGDEGTLDEAISSAEKAYCLLNLEGFSLKDDAYKLKDAAISALNFLSRDEDGFVIMIEQAHIDKFSHSNLFSNMVDMVNSLNDTVDAITEWIGNRNDTAILIVSDHETGGLSVSASADSFLLKYNTKQNRQISYIFEETSHTEADVILYTYGFNMDASTLPYYRSANIMKNSEVCTVMKRILNN